MDFPKTIYVGDGDVDHGAIGGFSRMEDTETLSESNLVAIYELKEVKKKVTNVELKDL